MYSDLASAKKEFVKFIKAKFLFVKTESQRTAQETGNSKFKEFNEEQIIVIASV